jgi:hypothetical protein
MPPMGPMGPGHGAGGQSAYPGPAMCGPLNPQAAPAGPSNLGLSASLPGAFTECPPCPPEGIYFNIGAQGLIRQNPRRLPIASIDVVNSSNADTGANARPGNLRTVETTGDISPDLTFGPRFTLGYYGDNQAIEGTGFYVGQQNKTIDTTNNGRLFLFFHNAPAGFTGDNGTSLFRQADRVSTTLTSNVGNFEINYRTFDRMGSGVEVLFGLRYLDIEEKLSIFTDDTGLSGNNAVNGQATDYVRSHNHILAPQLGVDFNKGLTRWLTIGATVKGAWGPNVVEEDTVLKNGTGSIQQPGHQGFTIFSQVYEASAYLEFWAWERCRIKGGYTALWAVDVSEVTGVVDFNLSNPRGRRSNDSSIFYHGPVIELELLF